MSDVQNTTNDTKKTTLAEPTEDGPIKPQDDHVSSEPITTLDDHVSSPEQ